LRLFSRNRQPLNEVYPEIAAAFRRQKLDSFVADGEVVAFKDGLTSFTKLQRRMQVQRPSAVLLRTVPVWIYLFDLLYLDRYDTRGIPLLHRKELLRGALDFEDPVSFTEHRENEGEACFQEACRKHWEGVIAKNGASEYVSGRSRHWLKFKCSREQEFVIGGYTDGSGGRIGFGALLLGHYRSGKLMYAGKVGTGFDTETLRRLGKRLAQLETPASPFAGDDLPRRGSRWVKPELVAQVAFTEWTADGKLRHPRFFGLRADKKPEQVVREG